MVNDDLAVIWAMSKDFGGSGLRAGVLMTGNQKLKQSMSNICGENERGAKQGNKR